MASRKRRATSKRRRRSTARRSGGSLKLVRRGRTVYSNPRRRGRRHRINPGIGGIGRTVFQGAKDAGATLAGGAAARTISNLIPIAATGLAGVAKGVASAVLVNMAARRFAPADTIRFLTAGAMQVPLKQLITTFIPAAGAFLGDYDNVIGAYEEPAEIGDYMDSGGFAADSSEVYSSSDPY